MNDEYFFNQKSICVKFDPGFVEKKKRTLKTLKFNQSVLDRRNIILGSAKNFSPRNSFNVCEWGSSHFVIPFK